MAGLSLEFWNLKNKNIMDKIKLICVTIFMVFYVIKYVMGLKAAFEGGNGFAGFLGVTIYYGVGALLLYMGGFLNCYF